MADRDFLLRIDEHVRRGNELMEEIRKEHRLNREEHRLNRAAFNTHQKVMGELILEIREGRRELRLIGDGIQATTQGLLHVLDELRRRNGPGGATA